MRRFAIGWLITVVCAWPLVVFGFTASGSPPPDWVLAVVLVSVLIALWAMWSLSRAGVRLRARGEDVTTRRDAG